MTARRVAPLSVCDLVRRWDGVMAEVDDATCLCIRAVAGVSGTSLAPGEIHKVSGLQLDRGSIRKRFTECNKRILLCSNVWLSKAYTNRIDMLILWYFQDTLLHFFYQEWVSMYVVTTFIGPTGWIEKAVIRFLHHIQLSHLLCTVSSVTCLNRPF